jgi:mevalonate pyrophosphate decarboxylase
METSTELTNALNRIKELEQIHDLEQEENIRLVEVIEDLEGKLKHNAEGWQNAVAEKDKYKDRVKELEAEVARLKEAIASNDLKTLGRIAQEQAAALWNENDRLKAKLETLQASPPKQNEK